MEKKNQNRWYWIAATAAILMALVGISACQHVAAMHAAHAVRPAESEFGLGPRSSAGGLYTATIESNDPLKPRRMYALNVTVRDAAGRPIEGATISVDGGMPEHGHGLPTRPRVTKHLGGGVYALEGLRFNMGGWWELELAITSPAGSETVTFNLEI